MARVRTGRGGAVDLALAASPRRVAIERRVPGRVRMGADALSELYLTNTGRRMLRGVVRDAWEPSAGASHHPQPREHPARRAQDA